MTNNQIATATITNVQIAANTITAQNIAAGTITTDKLSANTIIVAGGIQSTNATFGNTSSAGYWLDSSSGNATFGGQLNVGANLVVAGLINNSTLSNNTVSTQNIIVGAVTSTTTAKSKSGTILIGITPNSNSRAFWPDNTRGIIMENSIPSSTPVSGTTIVVNYSTNIYADANSPSNCVELWKYTGTSSNSYDRIIKSVRTTGGTNPDFYAVGAYGTRLVAQNITNPSPFASYNDAYDVNKIGRAHV